MSSAMSIEASRSPLSVSRRFQWIALAYSVACAYVASATLQWARLVFAVSVFMAAAAWESARYPRLCAHGSVADAIRTLLQVIGDIFLIPLYSICPGESPMLGYQPTPENLDILAQCPSLERFKQTPWLRNTYSSFIALMYCDFTKGPSCRKHVRRETLKAADGGVVALDWWEQDGCAVESKQAKGVLFIGSTFTGESLVACTTTACEYYTKQGWIVVVMVKRGCGLMMPNEAEVIDGEAAPAPWCLSGLADMTMSIDHVARMHPELPIVGLGFSTGGAQLRNYVNTLGKDSKLSAAVLVDAGAEWGTGFDSLDKRCPLISKALVGAAEAAFKTAGHAAEPVADHIKGKVMSGGLMEFAANTMAPAHGYERSVAGAWEYTKSCLPTHASRCAIPVLELLTLQDTILAAEDVLRVHSAFQASPHVVTATTQEGTHMVRWQGWRPECWVSQASCEFLEAALKVLREGVAPQAHMAISSSPTSSRCLAAMSCAVQRTRVRVRAGTI